MVIRISAFEDKDKDLRYDIMNYSDSNKCYVVRKVDLHDINNTEKYTYHAYTEKQIIDFIQNKSNKEEG